MMDIVRMEARVGPKVESRAFCTTVPQLPTKKYKEGKITLSIDCYANPVD